MTERLKKWIYLEPQKYPTLQSCPVSAFVANVPGTPALAVFRRVFSWDGCTPAMAAYSGDCRFRLFLNGKMLADGPVELGGDYDNTTRPDWFFYEESDWSGELVKGENVLVAEVYNRPDSQCAFSVGHPGFAFELFAPDGGEVFLQSDTSWRATVNAGWSNYAHFDATKAPEGDYTQLNYDDQSWDYAAEVSPDRRADWHLQKLDLPPLAKWAYSPLDWEESRPVTLGPDTVCQWSWAEELAGNLQVTLVAPPGTIVKFELSEAENLPGRQLSYTATVGVHTYIWPRVEAVQSLKISANGNCRIDDLKLLERHYPLKPMQFDCDQVALNNLMQTIDRSMRLCLQRMHWDSPVHQEPLGDIGDYLVEFMIEGCWYGDYQLSAADLRRTAALLRQKNGVLFHTSYRLLFVEWLYQYYWYSGDELLTGELFDVVKLILNNFAAMVGATGLVSEAPNYMFIDWISVADFNYHHPPASHGMGAMTAFYYQMLKRGAALALVCGEVEQAENYRQMAARLKADFRTSLWDAQAGLFRDGVAHLTKVASTNWLPPDSELGGFSTQVNILAAAFGLAEPEECLGILEKVMHDTSLRPFQPYFGYYLFMALRQNQAFDRYGFELLHRYEAVAAVPGTGCRENWDWGDYSHAWCGAPAVALAVSTIGVAPVAPGWQKIRIAPEFGELKQLRAILPTPRGEIAVLYRNGTAHYLLPRQMEYEIATGLPEQLKIEVKND